MRAHSLPAAAGWRWLSGGYAIFRRNPPLLSMLVVAYWFSVLLLNVFPVFGAVLASLAIPGLSVGLMQACRDLEREQPVGLQTLYGSLRQRARPLLLLGALYFVATLVVLGMSSLADGGEFLDALLSAKPIAPEMIEGGGFWASALVVAALMTPVLMAYWFAPLLVAWHGEPVPKSLFFSFVACWLNWRAFCVYAVAIVLFAGILPGLALGLLLVLFPDAQSFVTALLTVPMVLIVAPTLFASFYVSYRDVFASGISESA